MTGKNKKNNYPYIKNIRLSRKQLKAWDTKKIKSYLNGNFTPQEIKNMVFNEMNAKKINILPLLTQNNYIEIMNTIQKFLEKQLDNLEDTIQGYKLRSLSGIFNKKYYCIKCKKQHLKDSIIGLKHTNFEEGKATLQKIEENLNEIEGKLSNKKIDPNNAIIQIIDLCNFIYEEGNDTPVNEKYVLEKAINILIKIDTKSSKMFEFIENMMFDYKINREYFLLKLKELYPKKSIKLIQHFKKKQS